MIRGDVPTTTVTNHKTPPLPAPQAMVLSNTTEQLYQCGLIRPLAIFVALIANWNGMAADQTNSMANSFAHLAAQVQTNYAKGQISEAQADVDRFLNAVELDALDRLIAIESDVADFCKRQGDVDKAETILKRCVLIAETTAGSEHFKVTVALVNLGTFYLNNGKASLALPVFQRSLSIVEKAFGKRSWLCCIPKARKKIFPILTFGRRSR